MLDINQAKQITSTLLQVIKQRKGSNASQFLQHDILLKLLEAVCQIRTVPKELFDSLSEMHPCFTGKLNDNSCILEKHILYASCISSLVSYQCNNNINFVVKNPDHIRKFLLNSIEEIRDTLES